MELTNLAAQNVIRRLLHGEDYRIEILALINASFLQFAIDFFGKVAAAKLNATDISLDWYRNAFIDADLPTSEIIINAGLNQKTISNSYNTARRDVVLEVAPRHYEELLSLIDRLTQDGENIDITLTIKLRGVSVDLNLSESLIVINALAVKRAQIRGGAWSTAGKRVELPLMRTLCALYQVPNQHYKLKGRTQQSREVDFHLVGTHDDAVYYCEVKLMGQGNPESADAVIARDTNVFIADKLSDLNKQQLDQREIQWVELRSNKGYQKFEQVLLTLGIPYTLFDGDLDQALSVIFVELFSTS